MCSIRPPIMKGMITTYQARTSHGRGAFSC